MPKNTPLPSGVGFFEFVAHLIGEELFWYMYLPENVKYIGNFSDNVLVPKEEENKNNLITWIQKLLMLVLL